MLIVLACDQLQNLALANLAACHSVEFASCEDDLENQIRKKPSAPHEVFLLLWLEGRNSDIVSLYVLFCVPEKAWYSGQSGSSQSKGGLGSIPAITKWVFSLSSGTRR